MKWLPAMCFCIVCGYTGVINAQQPMPPAQQPDITTVKVLFWLDKYYLTDSAKQVLDNFISGWRNSDSLIMEGYCDYRASFAYNDRLAENRIRSVESYLKAKGFNNTAAYIHKPFGKRVKLDFRKNENGYAQNRAVLIKLKRGRDVAAVPPVVTEPPTMMQDTPKTSADTTRQVTKKPATSEHTIATTNTNPADNNRPALPPVEITEKDPQKIRETFTGIIKKANPGQSIVVVPVYFIEGRHVFVKSSLPVLAAVADAIKAFPSVEFEIQGHVCCTDKVAQDALDFETERFDLSTERAQAVFAYLVNHGVLPAQLTAVTGYGSRRRLAFPEKTEADRNRNRRVEFKIIKK